MLAQAVAQYTADGMPLALADAGEGVEDAENTPLSCLKLGIS